MRFLIWLKILFLLSPIYNIIWVLAYIWTISTFLNYFFIWIFFLVLTTIFLLNNINNTYQRLWIRSTWLLQGIDLTFFKGNIWVTRIYNWLDSFIFWGQDVFFWRTQVKSKLFILLLMGHLPLFYFYVLNYI